MRKRAERSQFQAVPDLRAGVPHWESARTKRFQRRQLAAIMSDDRTRRTKPMSICAEFAGTRLARDTGETSPPAFTLEVSEIGNKEGNRPRSIGEIRESTLT